MVLYVYFSYILLLFVSIYSNYHPKRKQREGTGYKREVLKTERQTRHLSQQMTRLPLLFY